MIVWCDLETTGLMVPHRGSVLEAAFLITTDELQIVHAECHVLRSLTPSHLWDGPALVMHRKSGLERESLETKTTLVEAVHSVIENIKRFGAEGSPLAGSTIGFDRKWLEVHMPAVIEVLGYRSIDVSTIKELSRRWNHEGKLPETPPEDKPHRAMPDILASLEELRWYRKYIFGVI